MSEYPRQHVKAEAPVKTPDWIHLPTATLGEDTKGLTSHVLHQLARGVDRGCRAFGTCFQCVTPRQLTAQCHEDWHVAHELGRLDANTVEFIFRPIWLIAAIAGGSERMVRHGITEARKLRQAIPEYLKETL